jgi:hypothetical protein
MTDLANVRMPSQHHIDMAREALERLQMKLGKVEARAILSSARANADKLELDELQKETDAARETYRSLVARFTHSDRIAEATAAIREVLQPRPGAASRLFAPNHVTGQPPGGDVVIGEAKFGPEKIADTGGIVVEDAIEPTIAGADVLGREG